MPILKRAAARRCFFNYNRQWIVIRRETVRPFWVFRTAHDSHCGEGYVQNKGEKYAK